MPPLVQGGGLLYDFLKKVLRTQNIRFAGQPGANDQISRYDGGACGRGNAPATINENNVIFPSEGFDFVMEIACWQPDRLHRGLVRRPVRAPIQRGLLGIGIDHQHLSPVTSKTGGKIGCHSRFSRTPFLVHHTDDHRRSTREGEYTTCCQYSCTAIYTALSTSVNENF